MFVVVFRYFVTIFLMKIHLIFLVGCLESDYKIVFETSAGEPPILTLFRIIKFVG